MRVADEPRELRVGAGQGAQQTLVDRVLQADGSGGGAAVELEKMPGGKLEHARRFAYARSAGAGFAVEHGEMPHELARPRERHAPLALAREGEDFDRAPEHDVARGRRLPRREEPGAALERQRAAAREELVDLVGVEAFEEGEQRQELAPVEGRFFFLAGLSFGRATRAVLGRRMS